MTRLQTQTRWGLCLAVLALAGFARPVAAQDASTCATDSDCDHGYTCQVTSSGGTCPAIDCAPGEDCIQPECDTTVTETRECVAGGPCEADADCIEGWLCAERQSYDDCAVSGGAMRPAVCPESDPDCNPVEPAPEPAQPPCEPTTELYCAPRYTQACAEAADCGPGFNCTELISMSCSGSTGSAGGDADPSEPPPPDADPIPAPEDMCTSTPSGEFYCELIETACETDQDCSTGLTCQDNWNRPSCTDAGGAPEPAPADAGIDDGSSGSAGAGAAPAEDLVAPVPDDCGVSDEPAKVCAPPEYFSSGRGDYAADGEAQASGSASDGDENGTPPTDSTSEQSPDDSTAPSVNAGDEDASDTMADAGGCSATGRNSAGGSAAFLMLAVLGLVLRRRTLRA